MIPEFQPAASDVDVCEMESVFVHSTIVPTATVRSSGAKARFPRNSAPMGIVTDDDEPSGAGVGAVGDGESPHATASMQNHRSNSETR